MKSGKLNDKLLYMRLSKKDKDAFIRTYDQYFDQIYRFIYFKVSEKEEAEDLTSAVFLKTWEYVQDNSIKDYKTLKSLLYRVARNIVIDHYRKKSSNVDKVSLNAETTNIEIEDISQNIHKKLEVASEYSEIEKRLLDLKDEYREIIVMRYVNELSVAEISKALEKTKGNVRVTVYRALKALREVTKEDKQ